MSATSTLAEMNDGYKIAKRGDRSGSQRSSSRFDAGKAFFASYRPRVPAHAYERRPHADGRHPHVALVDRFRLHDLSVLPVPARVSRGAAITPKRSAAQLRHG